MPQDTKVNIKVNITGLVLHCCCGTCCCCCGCIWFIGGTLAAEWRHFDSQTCDFTCMPAALALSFRSMRSKYLQNHLEGMIMRRHSNPAAIFHR